MSKRAEISNCTELCLGQGAALSSGTVALFGALPRRRQAGVLQQPRQAQHKALCDGPEKLLVLQYTRRCPEQCCPVQSNGNRQEKQPLSVVLERAPKLAQTTDDS